MIAIIPARRGSTRIPLKNIRPFHGKPIICYSIENALKICSRVIVSTDSDDIADIANRAGAEIHWRKYEFSKNDVGTQEVTANALLEKKIFEGRIVCLYATAPLIKPLDLIEGMDAKGYAVSVGTEPLRDAGAFYWGNAQDFINGWPLYSSDTVLVPLPESQVCDINTECDWIAAEKKFAKLYKQPITL